MTIEIERVAYGTLQYVKETKATLKTVEKAVVYTHGAVEMADGRGERINYLV